MESLLKCVLCRGSGEDITTGPLSTKGEVTAHQNCLLYSSGLFCHDSPLFDDLFGFSVKNVLSEKQRGLKLTCSHCKKKGATVGCEIQRCKKCYHYPCAIEAGAKTFEDKKKGTFGIYCRCCWEKKSLKSVLTSSDEDQPGTSGRNPKRKLDFGDRQERKTPCKIRRILSSNETEDSDVTDAEDQMGWLPPLDCSPEEVNQNEQRQSNRSPSHVSAARTEHENQEAEITETAATPVKHTETNTTRQNGWCEEEPNTSIDSCHFWRECASAGCAQAIFLDFINKMTAIFTRITSGQGSRQDCDAAFNVIMASGKLQELVAKQQTDLRKKLQELQRAERALDEVASFLLK
ncbi:unnamed protein product [Knipowitschia caucasica]|uniref:PHD-type domain-containing protein n=1 Tax=Knipowitschia caucasica TaxID=637954 RepID=A0AAV2JWU9_KNICA